MSIYDDMAAIAERLRDGGATEVEIGPEPSLCVTWGPKLPPVREPKEPTEEDMRKIEEERTYGHS